MGSIYFATETDLDPTVIALMGVSVKVGSTPIGHFGTGLKYAIATLLRTGHTITVLRSNACGLGVSKLHEFTVEPVTVRGQEFDRVVMDGDGVGFTTQLGRDWEVWMAYRELRSNCVDEGNYYVGANLPEHDWGTVVEVSGPGIEQAHAHAHAIFCQGEILHPSAWCEIRTQLPGTEKFAFYRGIRAVDTGNPTHYTYNITQACTLTEDRTLRYAYEVSCWVMHAIASCKDVSVLERVLLSDDSSVHWEDGLEYSAMPHAYVSPEFRDVCDKYRSDSRLNKKALALADKGRPGVAIEEVWPTKEELSVLNAARAIALAAEPHYTEQPPIKLVRNLGPNVYGCVRGRQVYVSLTGLEQGPRHLAATLLEEYLHAYRGLGDETRAMQDALLAAVVRMAAVNPASMHDVRAVVLMSHVTDVTATEVEIPF